LEYAFARLELHRVFAFTDRRNVPAHLWRTADANEEILHFDGHRGTVEWATFSADGAWAATSARDGTTCVWPTDPIATARRLPQSAATPTTRR
jgi:WD40 repeat protein